MSLCIARVAEGLKLLSTYAGAGYVCVSDVGHLELALSDLKRLESLGWQWSDAVPLPKTQEGQFADAGQWRIYTGLPGQ